MQRKEARKGYCEKCKKYFYVHAHHIDPKSQFRNSQATVDLCPNCHTHVHEYMNKHLKNPDDREENRRLWYYWLEHVSVTFVLLLVGLASVWWLLKE